MSSHRILNFLFAVTTLTTETQTKLPMTEKRLFYENAILQSNTVS